MTKQEIERNLIKDFMDDFYEKIGYYPTVATRNNIQTKEGLNIIPLDQLKAYFDPFLPSRHGGTLKLDSRHRARPLVELRFIFFYIARTMRYDLTTIGKYLKKRDHSTVIHGLTTFGNLYQTNEQFRQKYHTIINKIKQDHESSAMEYIDQTLCES
jgi:hypothetical protein